jgi:hypothetical protein
MDCPRVSGTGDYPIKCINFAHQVPLAEAADRRVARHRANLGRVKAHQPDAQAIPRADPRRSTRRLNASMPAANDHYVKVHVHRVRIARSVKRFTWNIVTGIKPTLFPDAEAPKERIEHRFRPRCTSQPVKGEPRLPQ